MERMTHPIPAKKSLGQHFLRCAWAADTLIAAARITKKDTVLEIGPGTGVLTRPLAAASGCVISVEKDERLATELSASLQKEYIVNVTVMPADILSVFQTKSGMNYDSRLSLENYKVVSNIPYYLTGRLIRLLLESPKKPNIIALTIQKEVAERIVARPPHMNPALAEGNISSTKNRQRGKGGMNLLALAVQAYGTPRIIKIVPANCFSPKPKIDSVIITISDISNDFFVKNTIGQNEFFAIARAAFGQKRKMLINTLPGNSDKTKIAKKLANLGIAATARPEELSLQNWVDIVRLLS